MAATGYTPIQLYRTSTSGASPTSGNLNAGELAINYNTADMSVWALNTGGSVVRLMNNPAGLKYPTTDGTASQALTTNGSGVLSWSSFLLTAGGTMTGSITFAAGQFGTNVNTFLTTPTSANLAAALTDETGSGSNVFATSPTLVTPVLGTPSSGTLSSCTVDGTNGIGYINIPQTGSDKTTAYTLTTGDVGKYVGVGTSGSIVVPNSTFANGDAISIFNNTSGNITLTMTITTAYVSGIDGDKATINLSTRGLATILFLSGTICVVSGNVS